MSDFVDATQLAGAAQAWAASLHACSSGEALIGLAATAGALAVQARACPELDDDADWMAIVGEPTVIMGPDFSLTVKGNGDVQALSDGLILTIMTTAQGTLHRLANDAGEVVGSLTVTPAGELIDHHSLDAIVERVERHLTEVFEQMPADPWGGDGSTKLGTPPPPAKPSAPVPPPAPAPSPKSAPVPPPAPAPPSAKPSTSVPSPTPPVPPSSQMPVPPPPAPVPTPSSAPVPPPSPTPVPPPPSVNVPAWQPTHTIAPGGTGMYGDSPQPVAMLAQGTPVKLVRTQRTWALVEREDGLSGWVDPQKLVPLR
ncbi:MAG: hypothetical protein WBH82_00780 [Arcanobacterium sp.]